MKTNNSALRVIAFSLIVLSMLPGAYAQPTATDPAHGITLYQYRRVPDAKRDEFVRRETTYWAEVAKKATEKGNLKFWALLEKVGGSDTENGSNFLFINRYLNVDGAGDVWGSALAALPNMTMDKIETNSMSTVTSHIFLLDQGWQQSATAVPDKDFMYVTMVYHKTTQPTNLVSLENKHFGPFIKSIMDKKQTSQMGWGNAIVLSPSGDAAEFNTVSFDLYSSLNEALNPTWDPKVVVPDGMAEIEKAESSRGSEVYRIVKVVSVD